MNPFYLFIGIFVIVKKLVDFIFDGIATLFSKKGRYAPKKLSDNDIEIYDPEKDNKDAG